MQFLPLSFRTQLIQLEVILDLKISLSFTVFQVDLVTILHADETEFYLKAAENVTWDLTVRYLIG